MAKISSAFRKILFICFELYCCSYVFICSYQSGNCIFTLSSCFQYLRFQNALVSSSRLRPEEICSPCLKSQSMPPSVRDRGVNSKAAIMREVRRSHPASEGVDVVFPLRDAEAGPGPMMAITSFITKSSKSPICNNLNFRRAVSRQNIAIH